MFPAWVPLNNAILLHQPSSLTAASAATELKGLYATAGVESWALWLPASVTSFGASDEMTVVRGMRRDTTTLVMELQLSPTSPERVGAVRTSVAAAAQAGDVPVPVGDLPRPDTDSDAGVEGWVMAQDGLAVAGAWCLIDGAECGVYAVSTVPQWRRRGLARALMQSILGDAYQRGARTATLQSTPVGEPLYRSLGFAPIGRYDEWVAE